MNFLVTFALGIINIIMLVISTVVVVVLIIALAIVAPWMAIGTAFIAVLYYRRHKRNKRDAEHDRLLLRQIIDADKARQAPRDKAFWEHVRNHSDIDYASASALDD